MTKRNPPLLESTGSLGSDEWHDIQQSVGALDTQVKANEKKKSKEERTNSYAKDNQAAIKKLKA
jgi:hypothetical protein